MIKLIAVGNRFMKDDGIAIAVVERLKNKLNSFNLDIIIVETDCQSGFYLLDENDFVIILDALCTGAEPGSISVFRLEDVMAQVSDFSMQHDMGIIELMKLHNRNYKGCLIGIESDDIDFGDKLSFALHEKLPQICSEVERTLVNIVLKESGYA